MFLPYLKLGCLSPKIFIDGQFKRVFTKISVKIGDLYSGRRWRRPHVCPRGLGRPGCSTRRASARAAWRASWPRTGRSQLISRPSACSASLSTASCWQPPARASPSTISGQQRCHVKGDFCYQCKFSRTLLRILCFYNLLLTMFLAWNMPWHHPSLMLPHYNQTNTLSA